MFENSEASALEPIKARPKINIGVLCILISAVLFSISTPLAKVLLGGIKPLHLAGFQYLGSGIGLALIIFLRKLFQVKGKKQESHEEARLRGKDFLWLAGAIGCGGVAGPILYVYGLSTTPASVTSLFLNSECILTAIIAFVFFKEAVGKRIWVALFLMMVSGVILSYEPSKESLTFPIGILLIVGACLMWGMDNNLTRHLAEKDPYTMAGAKGLVAGTVNLAIAWFAGEPSPSLLPMTGAMVMGSLSGASLVLFIYALRFLGAARTGAYFGTAPFIGAIVSVLLLKDPVTWFLVSAFVLIALAMWFLMKEDHSHEHTHEILEHEHLHNHDEHHEHEHSDGCEHAENHSHLHIHASITHKHDHTPDVHHRHAH